jgi:hypothetical protein
MRDLEIEGYAVPIEPGVWQRVLTYGVPRLWGACWTAICAMAFLMILFRGYGKLCLIPVACWPLGYILLVLLTLWDEHWDDVLIASTKYRSHYEAR